MKSNSDKTRELSDLKFIPQMQECIGCCMTFPVFLFSPGAVVIKIHPDIDHWIILVGMKQIGSRSGPTFCWS